jgi:flagellar hook-basal body complex protein FliE
MRIEELSIKNTPFTFAEKTQVTTPSFAQWLSHTNDTLVAADKSLQALASGQAQNLHETMLQLDEAKLSLQFLQQVRNRCLSAYQDLLREQI